MVWVVVLCLRLINIAKKGRSQYGYRVTRKSCRIFCFGSIVSRVEKKKKPADIKRKKVGGKKKAGQKPKKGKMDAKCLPSSQPEKHPGKKIYPGRLQGVSWYQ